MAVALRFDSNEATDGNVNYNRARTAQTGQPAHRGGDAGSGRQARSLIYAVRVTGRRCLHEKHGVDAAVVLGVVGDLRVLAPHDLASRGHETKFAHVDLQVVSVWRSTHTHSRTHALTHSRTSMMVPFVMTPSCV